MFFILSGFFLFCLIIVFQYKSLPNNILSHFLSFLGHFFTGQWGYSTLYHKNISSFISLYFICSMSLGFIALFSAFFFGLFLSFYALYYPQFSKWIQIILLGTPITVWAICINFIFGSNNTVKGIKDIFTPLDFILPWMVITLYHSCTILQMNYLFFKTESQKEYYQILSSQDISRRKIFTKYLIKPYLPNMIHNLGLKICILLGGSVGVENFFHLPGLGFLLRKSIIEHDISLLLTSSFLTLLFMTCAYFILDVLRISLTPKKEIL